MDRGDPGEAWRVGCRAPVREGGIREAAAARAQDQRRASPCDLGAAGRVADGETNRAVIAGRYHVRPRDGYLSTKMTSPPDASATPSVAQPRRSRNDKDTATALKTWVVLARAYLAVYKHVAADVARYDLT